jgi:hypothetical protein
VHDHFSERMREGGGRMNLAFQSQVGRMTEESPAIGRGVSLIPHPSAFIPS